MPTNPSAGRVKRVEYLVRCVIIAHRCVDEATARRYARDSDANKGNSCGPHRVIKRTISEEDITDA